MRYINWHWHLQICEQFKWSRMVVKQFQDGERPPFWKSIYRHISVKNHRTFMKFCTQQQILNWMNVTWSNMKKSCIGQTPSSTERISCFRHKARYWSKISIFSYPLHSTLALGVPRRNIAIPFGVQKLEWCGYPTVTKYRRVTDRWTDVTYGRTGNAAATMGVTKVSSAWKTTPSRNKKKNYPTLKRMVSAANTVSHVLPPDENSLVADIIVCPPRPFLPLDP